jgi:hypothetical protein
MMQTKHEFIVTIQGAADGKVLEQFKVWSSALTYGQGAAQILRTLLMVYEIEGNGQGSAPDKRGPLGDHM